MKKIILFVALMWGILAQAQNITDPVILRNMTNQWIVPQGAVTALRLNSLLNGTYNIIQIGDSTLRAKMVMDSITLASSSKLFAISDTNILQDRYFSMPNHQFYFDYDGDKLSNNYLKYTSNSGYNIFDSYLSKGVLGTANFSAAQIYQYATPTANNILLYSQLGNSSSQISVNNGILGIGSANNFPDRNYSTQYSADSNGVNVDVFATQTITGGYHNHSNLNLSKIGTALLSSNTNAGNASINLFNSSATLTRSNDGIAKDIITSVNGQVGDSTGNINVAGGAPMRFGIEDTTIGQQDRYLNISNGHQWYYDYDGDKNYNNFLAFGNNGYPASDFFNIIFSSVGNSMYGGRYARLYNNLQTNYFETQLDSLDSQIGSTDGKIIISSTNSSYKGGTSQINISGSLVTINRNASEAKNIITSVNNQLADINGNINTAQFTIAQRNALPIPSAGFTAFITDATANDTSVGVNQSWNGMVWKNNW